MATVNPLQFIQQVRSEVSKVVWPTDFLPFQKDDEFQKYFVIYLLRSIQVLKFHLKHSANL